MFKSARRQRVLHMYTKTTFNHNSFHNVQMSQAYANRHLPNVDSYFQSLT